jgi:hypothetical protein
MLTWNGLMLYLICRAKFVLSHVVIALSLSSVSSLIGPSMWFRSFHFPESSRNYDNSLQVREGAGDFVSLARCDCTKIGIASVCMAAALRCKQIFPNTTTLPHLAKNSSHVRFHNRVHRDKMAPHPSIRGGTTLQGATAKLKRYLLRILICCSS